MSDNNFGKCGPILLAHPVNLLNMLTNCKADLTQICLMVKIFGCIRYMAAPVGEWGLIV